MEDDFTFELGDFQVLHANFQGCINVLGVSAP